MVTRVDPSRVKAVGPDRAAAEWVLRLGGSVKFVDFDHWSKDYNLLPSSSIPLRLEAINNNGIAVTSNGLEHLGKLETTIFHEKQNLFWPDILLKQISLFSQGCYCLCQIRHIQP